MPINISEQTESDIFTLAQHRCGYCSSLHQNIYGILDIDYITPISKGGNETEENLWLICSTCNNAKSNKTEGFDTETQRMHPLYNPRLHKWTDHFEWNDNGTLINGKTEIGRVTVEALNLNKDRFIEIRRNWTSAGIHPPEDD